MRFEVLGPLRVSRNGQPIWVVPGRQRALLTALILEANHTVSVDRLIAALWGEDAPRSARGLVSTYVWRVRGLLDRPAGEPADSAAAARIVGEPRGYRLQVQPAELDVTEFTRLTRLARQALRDGEVERAGQALRAALALWRGEPAEDVRLFGGFEADLDQLAEMRAAALEARIAADLACGRHQELVAELRRLTAAYPLREGFAAQLVLSLARCGRQAEAVSAYHTIRSRIAEELGTDPGPALRRLYEAVLRGDRDPALAQHAGLPAVAPAPVLAAAAAAPPVPRPVCNLPPAIADFTGRTAELRAAEAATRPGAHPDAPAILAVVGMGGVGKTTLARQAAGNLAAAYPDGQLFVDLRGTDDEPVSCPQALARLLGLLGVPAGQVPTEPDNQMDLFRTLVTHRRILLLLDNARDEQQVRPLLAAGAGCATIVTSRNMLTGLDAVQRIVLDRMPLPEATAMFRRVCARPVAGWPDPAKVRDAVELCDRLPLAIRIAAARMAARPAWGIEELLDRLRDGDRLAELSTGDRSIDSVFDLSYRYLPPAEQELFDRLALLPTTRFDPAAAAAVLGADDPTPVRRRLERLVDLNLLQALPAGRYQRHDLLHLYALRHLRDRHPTLAKAVRPVLAWYLGRARHATALCSPAVTLLPPAPGEPDPPNPFTGTEQAQAWLDAEHHNLAAAVTQALAHGLPEYAWRLADLLRPYYHRQRHITDWLSITRAALQAAVARHDLPAQAAMHLSLGLAHKCTGRHDQAAQHYQHAERLARQAGWAQGEAAAAGNLGAARSHPGRPDQARTRAPGRPGTA